MTLNTESGSDPKAVLPILTGLSDILSRQTGLRGDKTALVFEGQSLTYSELDAGANKTANGLLNLDVIPNERVGHLGKNSHYYYELLFGTCRAGAVLCPINWRLALPEILLSLIHISEPTRPY